MRTARLALPLILAACAAREAAPAQPAPAPAPAAEPAGEPAAAEPALPPLDPPAPPLGARPVALAPPLELTLPETAPGFRSVTELLVRSHGLFGQTVKVRGFVVSIYDCAAALRKPGMSKADVRRILRTHPERCLRPHFALGATAGAPVFRTIEVVDVPRKPRPDELAALPEDVLAAWPQVPVLAVGDEVVVTGLWADRSPQGFHSSDGLLVFGSLEHVGQAP